jgi:hypothetical protein
MSEYKYASPSKLLGSAVIGGGIGAMYGMGDSEHNHANNVLHRSTGSRAAQGAMTGLGGAGAYSLMRGAGRGRVLSGLAALLSASGAAALAKPKLEEDGPYSLPY